MLKNTSGQKLVCYCATVADGLPKTGDAANLTAYVSLDYGAVNVLTDTSASELSSTNAKGYYLFDLAQAETNADRLIFTVKSSTSGVVCFAVPTAPFTETSAVLTRLGTPAGASIAADIAAISIVTGAGDFTTKTADSATLTTGSTIGGAYTDTASDNDVYWITAPVTPAVGGFGLRQQLVFNLALNRVPVNIQIRGWWNGTGTVDVYALNSRTAVYDKLTNTGTNLASRANELLYQIPLPRDYADNSGGSFNVVTVEFRAASTTTANRLRVDQMLVAHVSETALPPTPEQIWTYPDRTLTSPGVEPQSFPTNFEAMVITGAGGVLLGDGLAHCGTPGSSTATLAVQQLQVTNPSGNAIVVTSAGGHGLYLASSAGYGVFLYSSVQSGLWVGTDASGTYAVDISSGDGGGVRVDATGSPALFLETSNTSAVVIDVDGSNGTGIEITAQGSGHGILIEAGDTGNAVDLRAGTTSGDGLAITTTDGHGVVVAATGSSKHGVTITGGTGGTSDGMKLVAGTGGVALRAATVTAAITGNVTGNLSGTIGGATAAALKDFFDTDSLTTYSSAVAGSVVYEIVTNAGGGGLDAAGVRAAIGLASANLDTQLGIIAGYIDTEVAAVLAAVDTEVAAIKTKTDQLTFTVGNRVDSTTQSGLSTLDAAAVRTAVGLAIANLDTQLGDLPTNAELATALAAADDAVLAAIAALNNLSAAGVNAEMLDVLTTDTFAEPTAPPAATASLKDKIGWLAALARNKITQTATTQTALRDDGTTTMATSTHGDSAGTYTRGEWS